MITAFWNIAPCSLEEVEWRFRSAYCLYYQSDYEISRIHTSEILSYFLEIILRYIPEGGHIQEATLYVCIV
jgi:hypothetical protein